MDDATIDQKTDAALGVYLSMLAQETVRDWFAERPDLTDAIRAQVIARLNERYPPPEQP